MAEYLGIDMDTEPGLLDIAKMAVAAPTPPGWQQVDSAEGDAVFRSLLHSQQHAVLPELVCLSQQSRHMHLCQSKLCK